MSSRMLLIAVVFCAALIGTGETRAKDAQPANPLDTVPDKLLFDIPCGAPSSLERAEVAIAAALAEARKHDWKISIVSG